MSDTPRTSDLCRKHHAADKMPLYTAYLEMAELAAELERELRAQQPEARSPSGDVCKTHGLAVLVTHVNDGQPCEDYLGRPTPQRDTEGGK